MSRKESMTVYLDADVLKSLRALSKETKVPMSEYVREGVDEVLRKSSRPPEGNGHRRFCKRCGFRPASTDPVGYTCKNCNMEHSSNPL